MKTRHLICAILCALFAFGGTFTCKSSTHDDDDDDHHHHGGFSSTPAK